MFGNADLTAATGPKIDDVLDETKRRPFTSVSVRWLPSEKKSAKV